MALEQQSPPEELIASFSHQPVHILRGMISSLKPERRSRSRHARNPLISGLLDKMPVELSHLVLSMLDLRALSRLSQVSQSDQAIVDSLPGYQDLMDYAPHVLTVLGRTRLTGYHTVAALRANLFLTSCTSCGRYGPFFFLPTCKRCCYECLLGNPSLWVMPRALAQRVFALTPAQLKEIPVMLSIPGVYSAMHTISRKRRLNLVSIKAAKELGIKVNGSMEIIKRKTPEYSVSDTNPGRNHYVRWLQGAPLQPSEPDPIAQAPRGNEPNDQYCGMASILFPPLRPNKDLESALWCRGCEWTFRHYNSSDRREIEAAFSNVFPPDRNLFSVLLAMDGHARSKADFLEHIKSCYGVRALVRGS